MWIKNKQIIVIVQDISFVVIKMICASNFNRNHYITIITISFLAVFVVLAKVLLIDYQPPIVGKSDLNLKNHYYQGTVEKGKKVW